MKKLPVILSILFSFLSEIDAQQFNLTGSSKNQSEVIRNECKLIFENPKLTASSSRRSESIDRIEGLQVCESKTYEDKLELSILYDKVSIENEGEIEVQFDDLTGETLLFRKTSDGYLLDNLNQYTEEQQAKILNIHNYRREEYEKILYPNNVGIGDNWIIEGKELSYLLGKGVYAGKAEFTLVKVVNVRGEKMATILYNMDVMFQEKNGDEEMSEGNIVLSGKIQRSLTHYIDRDFSGTGLITMKGPLVYERRSVNVEIMSKIIMEGKERIFIEN